MKNAFFILALLIMVSACSKNTKELARPEGFYTVDASTDADGNSVFLRIENDRAIRYIVDVKNKSYAWEALKFVDSKFNGKLILEEATCFSSNKSSVGNVVEDLSRDQYIPSESGFFINHSFFRKLSQKEVSRLLMELETYNYQCSDDDRIMEASHEEVNQTTLGNRVLTPYLNPNSIQKNEVPLISGSVFFTEKDGIKNYILYSNKAYISFNFKVVSTEDSTLNKVSWIYYELLDGSLLGRKVRLQNSCPDNHPQSSQLAKLYNGEFMQKDIIPKSYFELIEDESTGLVSFGETTFKKLSENEWKKELNEILKAQVVCSARE